MAVRISEVYFEHHRLALGIGESEPRISWRFEGDAGNWTQDGYTIEILRASQSSPETFEIGSPDSSLVPWPTVSLNSTESATVRVKASGEGDHPDTVWSDPVTVETGLLNDQDWSGALMIAADRETEFNATHRPILLRNDFTLDSPISSARLYITAYGMYEAYFNGARVGTNVLAPGWQSYHYRHVYDTYDVTGLLLQGKNAIGIHVGEGWYSGRIGFETERNLYGDTLAAMALLVVTGQDGTKQYIRTDESWASAFGAVITSEIYDGETYDSRLEKKGWSEPDYHTTDGAGDWIGVKQLEAPYGRLFAPDGPPIRRIEEVTLKKMITSPSGKTILDFGQNLVGWLRLNVTGPEGQSIKMVHTEVLENGEVATRPLRTAKQTDNVTLSTEPLEWEPTFTYHGFRYVEVTGWPGETVLGPDSIKAIVVHSDMEETGSFECSNSLLNKLHSNVKWSMKGNFMSVPTDCPQRDERLGWTGDAHAFSPTANFLYDTSGFWRGWLKDAQSEQLARNGVPPVVVPNVPAVDNVGPTAVWGDVIVANPWNAYNSFGDLQDLEAQYQGAKAWLDTGIPRNEMGMWNRSVFQYGDWLDPLSPPEDAGAATTDATYVADAYLVYVTGLVEKMATALGLVDEAIQYQTAASDLKRKFIQTRMNADGIVQNETQTGLTLPLYFNLFPSAEQTAAAAQRLDNIIIANKYLVGTGFAGTHLLGLTLTKHNLTDTFYQMLLQTTVPSWLYQVVMDGTTTWERWDSLLPDGSVNPGSMTSFNHYAFGSVANWIYQTIGGLSPAEPGWKTTKVQPIPGGDITEAKASYLSPYGRVSSEWEVDSTGFHLTVVVPPNAFAEVILPLSGGTSQRVGSGTHTFEVPELADWVDVGQ
ncbi:extracellular glycosyl hydrolase family 78 protein [Xylariomycetidae sp. FL2044]|nr:extracellular glycosyl hydrolase family 78 protein [Xylariomycetidae sp. FL2044]